MARYLVKARHRATQATEEHPAQTGLTAPELAEHFNRVNPHLMTVSVHRTDRPEPDYVVALPQKEQVAVQETIPTEDQAS